MTHAASAFLSSPKPMRTTPLTCISVVFCTSISAGDISCAPAPSAAKACWHGPIAGEKAISSAAAVLTTVFLKLSASGNGDTPMRTADNESREALPLLLLLLLLSRTVRQAAQRPRMLTCFERNAVEGVRAAGRHTT